MFRWKENDNDNEDFETEALEEDKESQNITESETENTDADRKEDAMAVSMFRCKKDNRRRSGLRQDYLMLQMDI